MFFRLATTRCLTCSSEKTFRSKRRLGNYLPSSVAVSALFGRNLKGDVCTVGCYKRIFVFSAVFTVGSNELLSGIDSICQHGKRRYVRVFVRASTCELSFRNVGRLYGNLPSIAVSKLLGYYLKGEGLSVYYDRVSTLTRFSTSGCFRLNVIVISRVERRKRLGNGMRRIVYTRLGESSLSVLSRCNRNYPVAVGVSRCCDCNLKPKRLTVYIIGIKVISVCFAGR